MKALLPSEDLREGLGSRPAGVEVVWWDGVEPMPDAADVEFYVPPYLFGQSVYEAMARMPRLRVCQTLTAGVETVLPHLPDGVTLCNAKGLHDASTAELALTLMLASLRGVPEYAAAQQDGRWLHSRRPALADRTVLIVGYGAVGAAVERRLAGFEVEVLRVARRPREGVSSYDDLPVLLPLADVVVLAVPMTDETRGMVDAAFLERMRNGALLVNVARGPVVRTDDLLAAVRAGRITAALDVTDPEPLPPEHPLWRQAGVLISPHVGGNTSAYPPRAAALVADQVRRCATGLPLRNVVTGAY